MHIEDELKKVRKLTADIDIKMFDTRYKFVLLVVLKHQA